MNRQCRAASVRSIRPAGTRRGPFATTCLRLLGLVAFAGSGAPSRRLLALGFSLALAFPTLATAAPTPLHTYVSDVDATSATLNADVDFGPDATACHFEWGVEKAFDREAPCGELRVHDKISVSANAGQFKLTYGPDTTPDLPFNAAASEVEAALVALPSLAIATGLSVSGGPGDESASFPYFVSFTTDLGSYRPLQASDGTAPIEGGGVFINNAAVASARLEGLQPGTVHYFRALIANFEGPAQSEDRPFHTLALPGEPSDCPNPAAPGATFLPDCRAWELVSPPDKNGADVISDSTRTRAATSGNALQFSALGNFGDTIGGDIGSDYIARRSTNPDPGDSGWSSHAILPSQLPRAGSVVTATENSAVYRGDFSSDLSRGLLTILTPQTSDPAVAAVANLYRRSDLLQPGPGAYELLSACPGCGGTPLPPLPPIVQSGFLVPRLAGSDPSLDHVLFESRQPLTADTPLSPGCGLSSFFFLRKCRTHLYESDGSTTRLAGRVPILPATSCDDQGAPACAPADVSLAGQGTGVSRGNFANFSPHVISDGSDGHTRVFFTQPATEAGQTTQEFNENAAVGVSQGFEGRLYMRTDGASTVQIDASQRVPAAPFGRSGFADASADGHRAFFISQAQLTNDAPADLHKLYMYDLAPHSAVQRLTVTATAGTFNLTYEGQTTPDLPFDATAGQVQNALNLLSTIAGVGASVTVSGGSGSETGSSPYVIEFGGFLADTPVADLLVADGTTPLSGGSPASSATIATVTNGGHLTLVNADREPADSFDAVGTIGASADGHYLYFIAFGRLIAGQSTPAGEKTVYLWHDGDLRYVSDSVADPENVQFKSSWVLSSQQARVAPDGLHLLLSTAGRLGPTGVFGPTGADHGDCLSGLGTGCRELYLYSADTSTPLSPDLACASCNSSGEPAAAMATDWVRQNNAAADTDWHRNNALSQDGHYVFFSTAEALLPEDTNGVSDAYLYDSTTGRARLLSSGTSSSPSYFLESSLDGTNAFFSTRQRLSAWDFDTSYDVYDARIDGGFPEPPAQLAPCAGDSCRRALPPEPGAVSPSSATFVGPGDAHRKRRPCPRGRHLVRVHGKKHCLKHRPRHTNRNSGSAR